MVQEGDDASRSSEADGPPFSGFNGSRHEARTVADAPRNPRRRGDRPRAVVVAGRSPPLTRLGSGHRHWRHEPSWSKWSASVNVGEPRRRPQLRPKVTGAGSKLELPVSGTTIKHRPGKGDSIAGGYRLRGDEAHSRADSRHDVAVAFEFGDQRHQGPFTAQPVCCQRLALSSRRRSVESSARSRACRISKPRARVAIARLARERDMVKAR